MGQKGAWPSRGEDSELLGQGFVQINAIIPHAGHMLRASGRRAKGCVSGTSPVVPCTMDGREMVWQNQDAVCGLEELLPAKKLG